MGDIIASLVMFVLSGGGFVMAMGFPKGTTDGVPGAGIFPQAMCLIIMVLSIVVFVRAIKEKPVYFSISKKNKGNLTMLGFTCVLTAAFALSFGRIPFMVACGIYIAALGVLYGLKYKIVIPSAVVCAVGLFYVFQNFLGVMLNG